ncbi:MAG: hypothetical protein LAT56_00205 [Wenzhouxiangella sp.]|nr:hypothetical protein [Wenzhouxiangella sp.]
MIKINDGGPAFPQPDTYHAGGQIEFGKPGMTLRDWFAGQIVQGMHANDKWIKRINKQSKICGEKPQTVAAMSAYAIANAMIEEREESNE